MSISAALTNIAKYVFPKDVPQAFYKMNPAIGDMKKFEEDGGQDYRFTVTYSQGAVGSAQYARAYAVAGNVQYARFIVTRVNDYALARMNGEDYEALSSDDWAVVNAWKDRVETAYHEALRSLAISIFGDGSGTRGTISTVAGATVTLTEPTQVTNFAVGMSTVVAASGGGTFGAIRAGTELVGGLDRVNGTLTSTDVSWATGIAAIANGDFIYRDGDAANGGAGFVVTGLQQWLIGGATPGTLWQCNRNVDPVALAGTYVDYANVPMDEAVLDLAERVSIQDDRKKVVYVNPRDKVQLVKLLESKSRFMRPTQGATANVGFENIEFETDSGPMALKGDVNVKRTQFFMFPPELFELTSIGKAPKPLKVDGQLVRARDAFDAYEMRIGSYVNTAFRGPFAGGRGTSLGL